MSPPFLKSYSKSQNWPCISPQMVTGESTLWTFPSSTRISRAFEQRCLTSCSLMIQPLRSCSICLSIWLIIELQTSLWTALINLAYSRHNKMHLLLRAEVQAFYKGFESRIIQDWPMLLQLGVLNNIYLYISSIMTSSKPVAGFLVVLDSAELSGKIPFFIGENIIGRSQNKATLVIKQASISQKHARLFATPKKITLTDLGSKNGTKINNEDNVIEAQKEVEVDQSMVIYFAELKCRIEVVKNREQQTSKNEIAAAENERKKNDLLKKIEEQSVKISNQINPVKDQFKKIAFVNDIDLNQDFVAEIPKNEKAEKVQKQAKKKNSKMNKPAPKDNSKQKSNIDQKPNKSSLDQKGQKKPKKNKKQVQETTKQSSISKQQTKDHQKILPTEKQKISKEKQQKKKSNSPKMVNKSKPKSKSPKNTKKQIQQQNRKGEEVGQPKKKKSVRISNQKQQQRKSTSKQAKKKDQVPKKQLHFQKQAAQAIKHKEKEVKPEIKPNKKSKQKGKMNVTILDNSRQQNGLKHEDDEVTNTTKKRIGSRKKLPSQSLEKDLRQSGRRNLVGKRILFSGFVPKLRRKFFTIVQDHNEDFDYLVMKQYTRTFKALVAISKGIPIVKNTWIQDSEHCQRTMNPNHYRFSKLQYIYDSIQKVKAGQKVFQGYQIYLMSTEYHMKTQQIQTLVELGGGEIRSIKGQSKVKEPRKSIAIVRNRQENDTILPSLKQQIQRAKKFGFQLIYSIELLLEGCEKQKIDWQNNKLS